MEITVTLKIPEDIYQRTERLAISSHKPTSQILVEQLAAAQAIPAPPSDDPEQLQLQQEAAAYKTMHPQLRVQFPDQWVAIYQGYLIDHDADEDALIARLAKAYPGCLVLVRQVEVEPERDIYIPSFRLAV
ncbi:MAG: hypothetical protein R3A44_00375 [Caldilineaceae bacterium]